MSFLIPNVRQLRLRVSHCIVFNFCRLTIYLYEIWAQYEENKGKYIKKIWLFVSESVASVHGLRAGCRYGLHGHVGKGRGEPDGRLARGHGRD